MAVGERGLQHPVGLHRLAETAAHRRGVLAEQVDQSCPPGAHLAGARTEVAVSESISVQFATLEQLADELLLLGLELAGEAELCRSATYTFTTAVDGELGTRAGQLGSAWAGLVDLLGQDAAAVGRGLREAVQSYRVLEAELSDRHLYALADISVP